MKKEMNENKLIAIAVIILMLAVCWIYASTNYMTQEMKKIYEKEQNSIENLIGELENTKE